MKIINLNPHITTEFAKEELSGYLTKMGSPDIEITLKVENLSVYNTESELDDEYYISVEKYGGNISANNPRALLIAVYRYLTLIGCRFLRPGKKYEIVPKYNTIESFCATEKHSAPLRHRGVCIEGFDSIENIEDFLDWVSKIGFNSFFFQFKTPHTFLSRWYNYIGKEWTEKDSQKAIEHFNTLMAKRGLIRHRMGHGWTAEIIGAKKIYGWDNESLDIPENIKPMIAEVNGERNLMDGIAVNTNLCMTNPDALGAFGTNVVNYLTENPDTEYLHIWLADGHHNFCECENCKDLTPADQYINLLNHLDKCLTESKINTKLCLLMYEDLFWPPKTKQLNNPDRFVLMFAPIHRTFNQSYSEIEASETIPPFNLNKTTAPKDIASNMAFLREWKQKVPCDSFVYDYHLGRAHHSDPSHFKIAKIIYNDIKAYPQMELNGIISCQELRVSFPNAFANYVMAKASFDSNLSFEEIVKEYYTACYGKSADKLTDIMDELSNLFDCDYINYMFCPTPRKNADLASKMKKIPPIANKLEELIKNHDTVQYQVQEYMWNELNFFADYIRIFAEMIEYKCEGKDVEAMNIYENKLSSLVKSHEVKDQGELDVARLLHTIKVALNGNT